MKHRISISVDEATRARIIALQRLAECDLATLFSRALSVYERALTIKADGGDLLIDRNGTAQAMSDLRVLEVP